MRVWLVSVLFVLFSDYSFAFGRDGHLLVAQLAFAHLSDDTKAEMQKIMGKGYRQEWIASANWAQELADRRANAWMQVLHYVWFDSEDTGFLPDKHCVNNQCVVASILESEKVLLSDRFTLQDKRKALKYLVHYIADIHQPTNCGYRRDEGGRKVLLKTPDLSKVSLHWVWETGLLREMGKPWFAHAQELNQRLKKEMKEQWQTPVDPVSWAFECHEVAKTVAYELARTGKWNAAYAKDANEVIEEQLQKAAVRTAAMLNKIYDRPNE